MVSGNGLHDQWEDGLMIILGINEDHVGTAAIVQNGVVLASVSEERFSRLKNDTEYPKRSIDALLKMTGIKGNEIDFVAFASLYCDAVQMRSKRVSRYKISDYVKEMHEHWHKVLIEKRPSTYWQDLLKDQRFADRQGVYYDYSFLDTAPEEEWPALMNRSRARCVATHLGISEDRVRFVDHHKGHAHYAYFASPREGRAKEVVVTADGWGDGANATVSLVENGGLKEIHRTSRCELARLYRWTTLLLGMKPNEHEYKVMGLAPYAKRDVRQPAYETFRSLLGVEGIDFYWKSKPLDMYFSLRDRLEGLRFDGIAGGLQQWMEELLTEWIGNIIHETGAQALFFSGGLSMNVKANKVLAELPALKELHVPPSGGDESLAMGAAFALAWELKENPAPLRNAYLGTAPTIEETKTAVARFCGASSPFSVEELLVDRVADLLAEGKVLGRCVGPMEFGARSLGNRAILCDPSKPENLRLINEKIKFRDFWMPFTPSILIERAPDYLVNPKGIRAEYMTIAFDSTPLARRDLRAAIHPADFTVRPQIVSPESNADYHTLIKAFEKRTRVGAVLNTSLNLHGSPIVRTAEEAIDTLLQSGLDGMILPGHLILKK